LELNKKIEEFEYETKKYENEEIAAKKEELT